jgi:hypothetical protein
MLYISTKKRKIFIDLNLKKIIEIVKTLSKNQFEDY